MVVACGHNYTGPEPGGLLLIPITPDGLVLFHHGHPPYSTIWSPLVPNKYSVANVGAPLVASITRTLNITELGLRVAYTQCLAFANCVGVQVFRPFNSN